MDIVNTLMPFIKGLLIVIIGYIGMEVLIVLGVAVFWIIMFIKIWKESEE